jgi:hypothetical protein
MSEVVEVAVAEARGQCGNTEEGEYPPLEVGKPLPSNDSEDLTLKISECKEQGTVNCGHVLYIKSPDPITNLNSFYIHYPLLQYF